MLAAQADAAGVARIGIDIDRLGKAKRQAGQAARLSPHAMDDLVHLRKVVRRGQLFVRINPPHDGTAAEVESALRHGADAIMLPFFRTVEQADGFLRAVRGRAAAHLLVETATAVLRIRDIVALAGIDEVMLGLNDLRLEFGVASHFEILASPLAEMLAGVVHQAGLPLGIGGLAHPATPGLPVSPDLVIAQYPRLGATAAWIARSSAEGAGGFGLDSVVADIRVRLGHWAAAGPTALEDARRSLLAAARRPTG